MRGNGRVAVFSAVVRMSIGTIPHHEWCLAFDLQGYMSRSVLVANPAPLVLEVQPEVNCWLRVKMGSRCPHRRYPVRNSFTTASRLFKSAHDNGVRPFESLESVSTSSRARNSVTTASFPFSAANDNGVWPYTLSFTFTSTSSRARNSFTTASCPIKAAHDNGVRPFESLESVSTSSRARNSFTTASLPFSAAHDNGVWPYASSFTFTSTSSRAR